MSSVLSPASVIDLELPPGEPPRPSGSDRRDDIENKQRLVAELLQRTDAAGLLVLDQANLAWLTSGAISRGVTDPNDHPGLFFTPTQRWLLSCNVESQRMFDEELDGLGFLLKEWPWHWGREQLLADLCEGRRVVADEPFRHAGLVKDQLQVLRRTLTPYEQACYRQLGIITAHAVEAACRTCARGDTERELAGQIAHRLYRRGATPTMISVASDGRSRTYRRPGFTSAPVQNYAVVTCTARKYGLHASVSRIFSFGAIDETLRTEHITACKVSATYIASTWPDAGPKEILNAGRRIYQLSGFEHEWQLCPQGCLSGRNPVEVNLLPESQGLLAAGQCVTWHVSVGASSCCDTFLISDDGPERLTPTEQWPQLSLRVSGADIRCPYILER